MDESDKYDCRLGSINGHVVMLSNGLSNNHHYGYSDESYTDRQLQHGGHQNKRNGSYPSYDQNIKYFHNGVHSPTYVTTLNELEQYKTLEQYKNHKVGQIRQIMPVTREHRNKLVYSSPRRAGYLHADRHTIHAGKTLNIDHMPLKPYANKNYAVNIPMTYVKKNAHGLKSVAVIRQQMAEPKPLETIDGSTKAFRDNRWQYQNLQRQQMAVPRPSEYLWLSCLVFWFCNIILGFIAFILSSKYNSFSYNTILSLETVTNLKYDLHF